MVRMATRAFDKKYFLMLIQPIFGRQKARIADKKEGNSNRQDLEIGFFLEVLPLVEGNIRNRIDGQNIPIEW